MVAQFQVLCTSVSATQIHAQHVFLQLKTDSSSQLPAFPSNCFLPFVNYGVFTSGCTIVALSMQVKPRSASTTLPKVRNTVAEFL